MALWSPDGTATGPTTITGLTNPTYTYSETFTPDPNSRKYVVTTLGGTQTNVRVAAADDPFEANLRKDRTYKVLPPKNPVTGAYGNVPLNRVEFLFRKGLKIDSAGSIRVGNIRLIYELPAGCESNDAINIKALNAFAVGLITEEIDDVCNSLIAGVW